MLTLKFGGTSMGSARRMLDSVDIMTSRAKTGRISVVVSAVAGFLMPCNLQLTVVFRELNRQILLIT